MIPARLLRFAAAVALASCALSASAAEPVLFVYSTINSLLAGNYDGELSIKELASKGNFGMGTFNHLDGEMVALDGIYYHIRADGSVSLAAPGEQLPWANVLPFQPATMIAAGRMTSGQDLKGLEARIDATLDNRNLFYAVKIEGEFSKVVTRAIPAQTRPYQPLIAVSKTQVEFRRDQINGTLLGIRSPAFSKAFNVPGWHWHFISQDRTYGGHALAATLVQGSIKLAKLHRVELELPQNSEFAKTDQSQDRSTELEKIESSGAD